MFYFKKTMAIFILLVLFSRYANAQMKIAVMDFKAGVGTTQSDVDGISAIFGTYFINPAKFVLVERSQIDRVIEEQGFQHSSLTNQQIVQIGRLLNLHKMVLGDINIISGQYNVDVRIVDVETGAIDVTDGATWVPGSSYRELMKNMANRLMSQLSIPVVIPTQSKINKPVSPITLLGYLNVYPEDIGEYSTLPINIIASINQQGMYGYNDWRVPTNEELSLLKANAHEVGLESGVYIASDGVQSGFVRLVSTGNSILEKERTIQYLTKAQFIQQIYNFEKAPSAVYAGNKPCIILFYVPWDGGSRKLIPILEELLLEYIGKICIYVFDIGKDVELAAKLNIKAFPTMWFCSIGEIPRQGTGFVEKDKIKTIIDGYLLSHN